ncbi:MAG: hypothetical protein WA359_00495 [Acidimicrobiales bacterium]
MVIGAFSEIAYVAYSLIAVGPDKYQGFPWINGLFAAIMAALDFVAILLVLRHPTRIARVIILTDTELLLPDPKWRHVPISDVAGIGLGRYQPVLGSKRKGTWMPIFWRRDGAHLRVGGIGLTVSQDSPAQSKIANDMREIYRRVLEAQGPTGLLASQALQRSANLSLTDSVTSVWDPSRSLPNRSNP